MTLGALTVLLAVQAAQASVAGTVRDAESGATLAGAVVTLTDLDRATTTDPDGRYLLRGVPAGPHHVTIRFIGYAPRSLHALVPREGRLEINVALQPAPVRLQPVDVHATTIGRGTAGSDGTAFPDREISIAAVWNHPLLAEPDVFQALGGGEVVMRPEAPSGLHIRGGASDHTAYLLDGIPVLSPYHAAGMFSAWNPDALSRLQLSSSAPSPALPPTLSGAVEAVTRTPGSMLRAQGAVSTTQTRLTLDGPIGAAGAGYLVSVRSGYPGIIAPRAEVSYVRGTTADALAKLEAPAFGGQLRLLGYLSANDVDAAAVVAADTATSPSNARNVFEWNSRSFGVEWRRPLSSAALRVVGWSTAGTASSEWAAQAGPVDLTAGRHDLGLLAAVERRGSRSGSTLGLRVERSRTSYAISSDSASGPSGSLGGLTTVAAAFGQHARAIHHRVMLDAGAALSSTGGEVYFGPRAQLRWSVGDRLTVSGSFSRTHQFAQSLRNAESVVGTIYPVDLYVGAGARGVPVARSDQGVAALEYRPSGGVRLGVQAYERGFDGLLLVAPADGEPFVTGRFVVGSGAARGASVEATVSARRFGITASYGLQRVRLAYGDSSYVPDHGATHLLEGGVILFPTTTTSLRLGAAGALGRRTTTVAGGLEWEACNLVDLGCEFGGSPHYGGQPLGGTSLPAYIRLDLGVRQHFHLMIGGRDAQIALFGSLTNILGRRNVLTYARDPSTGAAVQVEMRPPAPLVVGLDWRF